MWACEQSRHNQIGRRGHLLRRYGVGHMPINCRARRVGRVKKASCASHHFPRDSLQINQPATGKLLLTSVTGNCHTSRGPLVCANPDRCPIQGSRRKAPLPYCRPRLPRGAFLLFRRTNCVPVCIRSSGIHARLQRFSCRPRHPALRASWISRTEITDTRVIALRQ